MLVAQHHAVIRNKKLNAVIFWKPRVLYKESRNLATPIDKRQRNSSARIGPDAYVNCMQSKTSFLQACSSGISLGFAKSTTALLSSYINQGSNG
jgi:hypothetical protein